MEETIVLSWAWADPCREIWIGDWETHLQKMFAFWSSLTLLSGRYHGQPMMKHLPLPVDATHFDRWLALFEKTAEEVCPPAAAASTFLELPAKMPF